ncbi:MAG TPA: acyloxyacyl hydrolase [Alphaproteobacteria bacterium]
MALAAGLFALAPIAPARAQDPSFVNVSVGRFDFNRQQDPSWEGGVQYRSDLKLWIFQPMVGAMHDLHGSTNVYAGISLDIFLGKRIVLRPSFAPSAYARAGGKDLGGVIEFRSAGEIAYRFDDRSRLGIEIYHLSNAHLYNKNPGEESVTLVYSLPTATIRSWFGD